MALSRFRHLPDADCHPVVLAWLSLPGARRPAQVERLTDASGRAINRKTDVFRLVDAAPEGATVIGKRALADNAAVERTVYEDVLPSLPVASLRYFGAVADPTGLYIWLFMEEATGRPWEPERQADADLAAEWLAALHARTALDMRALPRLRDWSVHSYRSRLLAAHDALEAVMDAPFATPYGEVARRATRQMEVISSHWGEVMAVADELPVCVVHSDFIPKNVRVVDHRDHGTLQVLDWDMAGRGVPLEDLVFLEPSRYAMALARHGFQIDLGVAQAAQVIGGMLQVLSFMRAYASRASAEWIEPPIRAIGQHSAGLAQLLARAGWASEDEQPPTTACFDGSPSVFTAAPDRPPGSSS